MNEESEREEDGWIQLYGGSVNTVFRKGQEVRRQMNPASPAVHQVLRWLERHNFQAPKLLRTADIYEFLTFLPGKPVLRPWPEEVKCEGWMAQLGDWLRRYHEVIQGFSLEGNAAFLWGPLEPEEGMIVCHGDLGPWNFIQAGGELSAVIDRDLAHYGDALDDVAELALEAVPLRPIVKEALGEETDESILQKCLLALCEAYEVEPTVVVQHIPVYLSGIIRETEKQAERGIEPFTSFVEGGIARELEADKAYIEEVWLK